MALPDADDVFDAEFDEPAPLAVVGRPARDFHEPKPGEYWLLTRGFADNKRRSLTRRTLLLVKEVRRIDGEIHSVVLGAHPLDENQYDIEMVIGLLFTHGEYRPDGAAIRQREVEGVQRSIADEQHRIALGPALDELPKDVVSPEPLPSLPSTISEMTALANPERRAELQAAVQRHLAVAEAQSAWLTQRHGAIQSLGATMARYYAEQGQAALAQVSAYKAFAEEMSSGVKTMGLFIGEDVEVITLCKGTSAPPDVPLALYQRRVYMDEEYATHLALGGATWRTFDDFAAALASDASLRDRVLPLERCVVAMSARRKQKAFSVPYNSSVFASFQAFQAYMEEYQANKRTFLLVRDGENLYQVNSPLSDDASRLFPTEDEKAAPFTDRRFHGVDEKTITPDSVKYYDARSEYDKVMLYYRRLLVLMWGLDYRLGLFGPFYDPKQYPSFMSLQMQMDRFLYIYDEDMLALGEDRLDWHSWVATMNAYLDSGSRVLLHFARVMDDNSAPSARHASVVKGAGDTARKDATEYTHKASFGVRRALRRGGEFYVDVAVHKSWGERTDFTAKVALTGEKQSQRDGIAYLVLDAVTIEDLNYYIASRVAREDYDEFLALFLEARQRLEGEAKHERPLRDAIAVTLDWQPDALDEFITLAFRGWRMRHRDADLLDAWRADQAGVTAALAERVRELKREQEDQRETGARLACETGRLPLCITRDRKGEVRLYATSTPDEQFFGGVVRHPWVASTPLNGNVAFTTAVLRKGDTSERLLSTWPDMLSHTAPKAWHDRSFTRLLETYRDLTTIFQHSAEALTYIFGGEHLDEIVARYYELRKDKRHGYCHNIAVPIGICLASDHTGSGRPEESVLVLEETIFGLLCAHGQPGLAGTLVKEMEYHIKDDGGNPVRYYLTSRPYLSAMELPRFGSHLRSTSDDPDGARQQDYMQRGFGLDYTHFVASFGRFIDVDKTMRAGELYGPQLADLLDMSLRSANKERVLYLAPGVDAALRSLQRVAVERSKTKRRTKPRAKARPASGKKR